MPSILRKEEKGYHTDDNATRACILAAQAQQHVFSVGANDP